MKYIKRTVSVLLLLCLLLSMAGCKTAMPNLEADEARLINEYISLIGSDKETVYAKLSLTEDLLQENIHRYKILPTTTTISDQDFEVLLAFNPATDILNCVEFQKHYPLDEANLNNVSIFLQKTAQYLTEKYGTSYTELCWQNYHSKSVEKPFLYADNTPEAIAEYIKGETEHFDWIATDSMPQSVQDYAHSMIGQEFGSFIAREADIIVRIVARSSDDKIGLRISYAGDITERDFIWEDIQETS